MIKLHPKDSEIQHNWLVKHTKANLITMANDLPAIAVYVNPIWRDKVNTANLLQAIKNVIEHYEKEI